MILQADGFTETVDAVGKMSNLISEQSAMVVAMAILFIGFIVMFLNMIRDNRKSDNFNKEYLNSMAELKNVLMDQSSLLQSHTTILRTLLEGVSDEISARQVDDISDMFFSKSLLKVLNAMEQIVRDNHIADKESTCRKIDLVASNIISYDRERALSFKFKGQPLSYHIGADWKDRLAEAIIKEIYSEAGYNSRVAKTNIEILYKQFRNEFVDNIHKNATRS